MARLGPSTDVRSYKRRAGSYTDGCTRMGHEGTQAQQSQQQHILEDDTLDQGAHTGSRPQPLGPSPQPGGQARVALGPQSSRLRWRHLVLSSSAILPLGLSS